MCIRERDTKLIGKTIWHIDRFYMSELTINGYDYLIKKNHIVFTKKLEMFV